jgi:transcriptional regulator with XRE-family HTH domain
MPDDSRRERLRAELVQLRMRAGIGGRPMGRAIGSSQGTVYRIEHGETLPSVPHVRKWLDAVAEAGVDVDRARILDLTEAIHAEVRGWGELLDNDGHAQRDAATREAAATRIRNYQPTVIGGLLQTPEYARALFSIGRTRDVGAAVAARLERQQRLYEPGRRFEFLIAENVLAWPVGGPEVLAAQRDRVVSLAKLDTVTIGVVPAQSAVAAVWHNFVIWDVAGEPPAVTAELVDGEHEVRDPDRVALYEQVWDRLWGEAVFGEDAVALIRDR